MKYCRHILCLFIISNKQKENQIPCFFLFYSCLEMWANNKAPRNNIIQKKETSLHAQMSCGTIPCTSLMFHRWWEHMEVNDVNEDNNEK
jgi:hypothetical protein